MAKLRWPLIVRRVHKWLALFVGVQALIWVATGFYMVVVDLDVIHGDHLVRPVKPPQFVTGEYVSPANIARAAPDATEIRLDRYLDAPVWRAEGPQGARLFDARSGAALSPPDQSAITQLAKHYYAGTGDIVSVHLRDRLPQEVQSRKAPLWQVEFSGWNRPTLYLSPATGELVARRHALWRIFDFAWMLHIMDYDARTDSNNMLLRVASGAAFIMALSGAVLLLWSFRIRARRSRS